MNLVETVDEIWPRVCRLLRVDPESIRKPRVEKVPYGVIELFGGSGIMYHPGDNAIMVSEEVDRGQMAHEVAHAVRWQAWKDDSEYWPQLAEREVV